MWIITSALMIRNQKSQLNKLLSMKYISSTILYECLWGRQRSKITKRNVYYFIEIICHCVHTIVKGKQPTLTPIREKIVANKNIFLHNPSIQSKLHSLYVFVCAVTRNHKSPNNRDISAWKSKLIIFSTCKKYLNNKDGPIRISLCKYIINFS